MIKSLSIAVITASLLAAPALAFRPGDNWAPGAPGYGPPGGNRDPDAVRCQNRRVTGSRARTLRVCLTNAQWAELREAGSRNADLLLDDGTNIGEREPGVESLIGPPCPRC